MNRIGTSLFLLLVLGCAPKKLRLQTFEEVWSTVNETYPYEDFGGVNWTEQREIYEDKAKRTKDGDELRHTLEEMLAELGVSHMAILPQELYLEEDTNDSRVESPKDTTIEKGWAGVEARWIEDKLVITSVEDDLSQVSPGMEITKFRSKDIASYVEQFTEARERSFHVGRLAISSLEGDVGDSIPITVRSAQAEPAEVLLEYQQRNTMTAPKNFNLPSSLVRFEHSKLSDDIHYLSFNVFLMPIRDEIEKAFVSIVKDNPSGLIIDLRGNPGGFIDLGVYLCSFFVSDKDQDLGRQISRDGELYLTIYPRPQAQLYDGNVVVLIDELSASTSEVVAGGLQELGYATIIGQTSAGKALPSVIKNLANGDRFQYVVADLIKPSGGRFEEAGVTPDITVTRKIEDYQQQRDPELDAAIAHLMSISKPQNVPTKTTDP